MDQPGFFNSVMYSPSWQAGMMQQAQFPLLMGRQQLYGSSSQAFSPLMSTNGPLDSVLGQFGPMATQGMMMAGNYFGGGQGIPTNPFMPTGGDYTTVFNNYAMNRAMMNVRSFTGPNWDANNSQNIGAITMAMARANYTGPAADFATSDQAKYANQMAANISAGLDNPMVGAIFKSMGAGPLLEMLQPNVYLREKAVTMLARDMGTTGMPNAEGAGLQASKLAAMTNYDPASAASIERQRKYFGYSGSDMVSMSQSLQSRGMMRSAWLDISQDERDIIENGVGDSVAGGAATAAAMRNRANNSLAEAAKENIRKKAESMLPAMAMVRQAFGLRSDQVEETIQGMEAITGGSLGSMSEQEVRNQVAKFAQITKIAGIAAQGLATLIQETVVIAEKAGLSGNTAAVATVNTMMAGQASAETFNSSFDGIATPGVNRDSTSIARSRLQRTISAQGSSMFTMVSNAHQMLADAGIDVRDGKQAAAFLGRFKGEELKTAQALVDMENGVRTGDTFRLNNGSLMSTVLSQATGVSFSVTGSRLRDTQAGQQINGEDGGRLAGNIAGAQFADKIKDPVIKEVMDKFNVSRDVALQMLASADVGGGMPGLTNTLSRVAAEADMAGTTASKETAAGIRKVLSNKTLTNEAMYYLQAKIHGTGVSNEMAMSETTRYSTAAEMKKFEAAGLSAAVLEEELGGLSAGARLAHAFATSGDDTGKMLAGIFGNAARAPLLESLIAHADDKNANGEFKDRTLRRLTSSDKRIREGAAREIRAIVGDDALSVGAILDGIKEGDVNSAKTKIRELIDSKVKTEDVERGKEEAKTSKDHLSDMSKNLQGLKDLFGGKDVAGGLLKALTDGASEMIKAITTGFEKMSININIADGEATVETASSADTTQTTPAVNA